MKKLLRNGGLVEKAVLLERGDSKLFRQFSLRKSMFSLLLELLSGKYSHSL